MDSEKSSDSESEISSHVSYKNLLTANSSNGAFSLIKPREYQKSLIEFAKAQNTIVYLGTGLGKTLIAIYIIKDLFEEDAEINKINEDFKETKISKNPTQKAFFVVKTRNLVKQQAKAIDKLTGLKVGQYHCIFSIH